MEFSALIKEFGPLLSRVASSYEAIPSLQEELLQEVYLAVWQSLSRFKGSSSLKTYILRVAHNKAITHVTQQVRIPYQEDVEDHALADPKSPESNLVAKQREKRLLDEIRKLSIQARQVVTMSLEGLSYQDIGDITGLSVSNVGVVINRAKAAIKSGLENDR